MKKTTILIATALLVIVLAIVYLGMSKLKSTDDQIPGAFDPKNGTYSIGGQTVTLKDGVAEVAVAPDSASKIVTRYFGNDVKYDLDNDGREDAVFLVTQEMGGSGTFYYAVAALNTASGLVGSQGLLIGDRIAPQTTEMSREVGKENIVVVNYADRAPGESFAVAPSAGKSILLKLDTKTMQFGEVVQDFEGEADPAKMTLGMKTWNWISTTYDNDRWITPRDTSTFALTFKSDGTFSARTDCNGVGGNYAASWGTITFDKMMSTLMYCEGSQEGDFTKMIGEVKSYHFTSKGELIFDLKVDSGSMIFR